jgi:Tfp pilus assembly protein PilF
MKARAFLLLSMMLAACAGAPVAPPAERLFNDRLFAALSERISADQVFAPSDEMKRFVAAEIGVQLHGRTQQQAFIDALWTKGKLRIEYDSTMTRNAAETFAERSGNCLSLVIMTSTLAKEMGLPVRYQVVYVDDTWNRVGDVYFSIAHVNIGLGKRKIEGGFGKNEVDMMTIDFLPAEEIRGVQTRTIGEETVVAMYMNNRAAEMLSDGRLDDAYWWARAGILQDPGFSNSYNTLGVVYRRHGNLAEAGKVLAYALEREPRNANIMSNLALVLSDLGRVAEAKVLAAKVAQLEPDPPFSFFNRGMAAMRNGDYKSAKNLFAREVDRAPYYHEFHFWLAMAHIGLGEIAPAKAQLTLALETSSRRKDQSVYAAKLARLDSHAVQ